MQSKISSKWSLFIISIVGIAFVSIIVFSLTLDLPGQDFYEKPFPHTSSQTPQNLIDPKPAESVKSAVLSIRLKIPKINVDAAVESVGLTLGGEMGVPKGLTNAGWFNRGPRPGEMGSSVIDGHSGWKNAVFDNLYKLRQGDKIYVEDDKGAILSFVVRESRSYDPKADASDVFGSNDGAAHLNLITCEGVWNESQKSYSKRLVVFADKEME